MPIYWRFLLGQFLKVMFLSTAAFVAILMTTRLDEIAHFASLGSTLWLVLRFAANQIPYMLPIAIPVACLISSLLLLQRLSATYELTALRASGLSIRRLLTPILLAALYLSLANFYIVSELATDSHLFNNTIKNELRALNPLLLMHNRNLMNDKGIYFDTLGASKLGERAEDVVFAMPTHNNENLHIAIAKKVEANDDRFSGEDVSFITAVGKEGFVIENIGSTAISVSDFSQLIQKRFSKIHPDHLKWGLLRVKYASDRAAFKKEPTDENRRQMYRGLVEMVRRFSVALAALTFTLMGAAFGISISRKRGYRSIVVLQLLAASFLASYFAAKAFDTNITIATLLYTAPQLVIILLSTYLLRRAARGVA